MAISPLRYDPSRTATLRRKFTEEIQRRLRSVQRDINQLIIEEDAFGLRPKNSILGKPTLIGNEQVNNELKRGALIFKIDSNITRDYLQALQLKLDNKDVIEYETEPHVTGFYGFSPEVDAERVALLLQQYRRFFIEFGELSCFHNPDFDVLKIAVDSEILKTINSHLKLLPHVETYREFKGHLTLAYLRPGTAVKYLFLDNPLSGTSYLVSQATYSTAEREQTDILLNTKWRFHSDTEKINSFGQWLKDKLETKVLGGDTPVGEDQYWENYIQKGYEKGAGRAFDEVNKYSSAAKENLDFYQGSKYQFLKSSFGKPETVAKVKLLAGRVFTELKGVTEQLSTKLTRSLTDGLVQGMNPKDIAKSMGSALGMSSKQAETIARTEIIRAHAEGAIDHYEELGVHELGVMVEWSTAGDGRVCPLCQVLNGIVITTKEAKGMFPRHPNCRCTPIPANILDTETGQTKSKKAVQAAIDKSITLGLPKSKQKLPISERRKETTWAGGDKKLTKDRPEPVLKGEELGLKTPDKEAAKELTKPEPKPEVLAPKSAATTHPAQPVKSDKPTEPTPPSKDDKTKYGKKEQYGQGINQEEHTPVIRKGVRIGTIIKRKIAHQASGTSLEYVVRWDSSGLSNYYGTKITVAGSQSLIKANFYGSSFDKIGSAKAYIDSELSKFKLPKPEPKLPKIPKPQVAEEAAKKAKAAELAAAKKAKETAKKAKEAAKKPSGSALGGRDAVDDDFVQKVKDSRINGRSIFVDQDDIEDSSLLVWEELNDKGEWVTKVKGKLTEKGQAKLLGEQLASATATAAAQGPRHFMDVYWSVYEDALKTVNNHVEDKLYNQATLHLFKEKHKGIKQILQRTDLSSFGDPEIGKMYRYYENLGDSILEALEKGTSTRVYQPFASGLTSTERAKEGLKGLNKGDINLRTTTISKGRAAQQSGNYTRLGGSAYTAESKEVKLSYIPIVSKGAKEADAKALSGSIEFTIPGEATKESISKALDLLEEVSISSSAPTQEFIELEYLKKNIWSMKLDHLQEYQSIVDTDTPDSAKVSALKRWLKTKNVETDNNPYYDPLGTTLNNQFGDGQKVWYRFDLTPDKIKEELEGYTVFHRPFDSDIPAVIDKLLESGGQLTSTTERIRKGIPIYGTGKSPGTDLRTGGAEYAFTTIVGPDTNLQVPTGLHFDRKVLGRVDAFSYDRDNYGNTADLNQRMNNTIEGIKKASIPSTNETMFKDGLSLLDDLDEVVVPNDEMRKRAIEVFKKHKISEVNGKKLEDLVITYSTWADR